MVEVLKDESPVAIDLAFDFLRRHPGKEYTSTRLAKVLKIHPQKLASSLKRLIPFIERRPISLEERKAEKVGKCCQFIYFYVKNHQHTRSNSRTSRWDQIKPLLRDWSTSIQIATKLGMRREAVTNYFHLFKTEIVKADILPNERTMFPEKCRKKYRLRQKVRRLKQ